MTSLIVLASAQRKPTAAPPPKPAEDSHLYRNTTFGFRYQIPYGWVERTKEMREQPDSGSSDSPDPANSTANSAANSTSAHPDSEQNKSAATKASAQEKTPPQGEVLLAIFERPPNAPGGTVNSAVVIVSESAAAYPGLKKAEDYLAPLTELATAKGFKPEGDPGILEIDSRQLIRADFSKPLAPNKDGGQLTMHQSTLIFLTKGQIVSLTFIAGTADEIDDLIANLHFTAAQTGAP